MADGSQGTRIKSRGQVMPLSPSLTPLPTICQIETGLYLGKHEVNFNPTILTENNIKRILIINFQITSSIRDDLKNPDINYKFMDNDLDIIPRLMECIQFIKDGQTNKENVLVNCEFDYLRGAVVVIAFIMNKNNMEYKDAVSSIQSVNLRERIVENLEYLLQLNLFEKMKYKVDVNNKDFRLYLFTRLLNFLKPLSTDDYVKSPEEFQEALNIYFEKLEIAKRNADSEVQPGKNYVCRNCNYILFSEIDVIKSERNEINVIVTRIPGTNKRAVISNPDANISERNQISDACERKRIFIQPKRWMSQFVMNKPILNHFGSIICVKCRHELGVYNISSLRDTFVCRCPIHEQFCSHYISQLNPKDLDIYDCLVFKIYARNCKLETIKPWYHWCRCS